MLPAVKTSPENAKKLRQFFETKNVYDNCRKVYKHTDGTVIIPVKGNISETIETWTPEDNVVGSMKFTLCNYAPPAKRPQIASPQAKLISNLKILFEQLGVEFTDAMIKDIPQSWERHDDMIVLSEGCFSQDIWSIPALKEKVYSTIESSLGCTRLAQKSVISDDNFRSPSVKLLTGTDGWVKHVDNKISYIFDITKCMFSSGNITEKLRVANINCAGQVVVDLYAGIGYFTLPYLVHAGAAQVYACEWNPHAVEALTRNLKMNNVFDKCTVLYGDNRKVCPVGVADRVNLGLIPSSEDGWPIACLALKPDCGGMLHIHANVTSTTSDYTISGETVGNHNASEERNSATTDCDRSEMHVDHASDHARILVVPHTKHFKFQKTIKHNLAWKCWAEKSTNTINKLLVASHGGCWNTDILHIEHVKSYAPHVDHLVLDLHCRPIIKNS